MLQQDISSILTSGMSWLEVVGIYPGYNGIFKTVRQSAANLSEVS